MMIDELTRRYFYVLYENSDSFHSSLKEYAKFLSTATYFGEDFKVVSENRSSLFDIPDEAIQFLLENSHKKIGWKWLKDCFKSSRHWRNIKNIDIAKSIYFDVFHFDDKKEIDRFNSSCFGIRLEDLEEARKLFIDLAGTKLGFCNFYEPRDIYVICINAKNNDIYQAIHHEVSHFLQMLCGIRIIQDISPEDLKNRDLLKTEFGSSYNEVIDYFSKMEFAPHVDDIVSDLKSLRENFYRSIDGADFELLVLEFLKSRTKEEVFHSELFNNFKKMKNGEVSSLMMLLFSKISGYKFQKIMHFAKEAFL